MALYRVGQFLRALIARVTEEEVEQATHILTPAARALFRRQAIQDQRHAMEVYHALRRAGHTNPQLLVAALLHDVGKAAVRLPAWQRAMTVLLDRFAPHLLERLSQGEPPGGGLNRSTARPRSLNPEPAEALPSGWRRPFAVHARHPGIGARWAQAAGCSPLTVALIRRHHERPVSCRSESENKNENKNKNEIGNEIGNGNESETEQDQLLAALQAADSLN
jgi:hypothetical protein